MKRLALISLLCASTAWAIPDRIERLGNGQDWIEIREETADRAVVTFHNHVQKLSRAGHHTLQVGDIIVEVQIEIGGAAEDYREVMTVRPREPYIAIPERIMAHDGETVSVEVVLPMF